MRRHIALFLICSAAACRAQGIASVADDEVARLSVAADKALKNWMTQSRDVMTDVLGRPPKAVVERLDEAKRLLGAYSDIQLQFYSAMDAGLTRDIAALEKADSVNWESFASARSKALGQRLATLHQQELGLNAGIQALAGKADSASQQQRALLEVQLSELKRLKDILADQRSAYETEPGASQLRAAIAQLQEQQRSLRDLKSASDRSRGFIESAYVNVKAAVLAREAAKTPEPAPPAKDTTGAQRHAPPAGTKDTKGERSAIRPPPDAHSGAVPSTKQGLWSHDAPQGASVSRDRPAAIDFVLFSASDPLRAQVRVWFKRRVVEPDLEVQCDCAIESNQLNCACSSTRWKNGVFVLSPELAEGLLPSLPPTLVMQRAEATSLQNADWSLATPLALHEMKLPVQGRTPKGKKK